MGGGRGDKGRVSVINWQRWHGVCQSSGGANEATGVKISLKFWPKPAAVAVCVCVCGQCVAVRGSVCNCAALQIQVEVVLCVDCSWLWWRALCKLNYNWIRSTHVPFTTVLSLYVCVCIPPPLPFTTLHFIYSTTELKSLQNLPRSNLESVQLPLVKKWKT